MERDVKNIAAYKRQGWHVLTIWECALKGKKRLTDEDVLDRAVSWLCSGSGDAIISGEHTG